MPNTDPTEAAATTNGVITDVETIDRRHADVLAINHESDFVKENKAPTSLTTGRTNALSEMPYANSKPRAAPQYAEIRPLKVSGLVTGEVLAIAI